MNQKIRIRLDSLKNSLVKIEEAYQNTLKDPDLEMGFEYEKPYPINQMNNALWKKAEKIREKR